MQNISCSQLDLTQSTSRNDPRNQTMIIAALRNRRGSPQCGLSPIASWTRARTACRNPPEPSKTIRGGAKWGCLLAVIGSTASCTGIQLPQKRKSARKNTEKYGFDFATLPRSGRRLWPHSQNRELPSWSTLAVTSQPQIGRSSVARRYSAPTISRLRFFRPCPNVRPNARVRYSLWRTNLRYSRFHRAISPGVGAKDVFVQLRRWRPRE